MTTVFHAWPYGRFIATSGERKFIERIKTSFFLETGLPKDIITKRQLSWVCFLRAFDIKLMSYCFPTTCFSNDCFYRRQHTQGKLTKSMLKKVSVRTWVYNMKYAYKGPERRSRV